LKYNVLSQTYAGGISCRWASWLSAHPPVFYLLKSYKIFTGNPLSNCGLRPLLTKFLTS